jgi:hypothetical protein
MAKVDPFQQWVRTLTPQDYSAVVDTLSTYNYNIRDIQEALAAEHTELATLRNQRNTLTETVENERAKTIMKVQKNPSVYYSMKKVEMFEKEFETAQETLDKARAAMREQILANLDAEIDRRLTNDVRRRDAAQKKLMMEQVKLEALTNQDRVEYLQTPKLFDAQRSLEKVQEKLKSKIKRAELLETIELKYKQSQDYKQLQKEQLEEELKEERKRQEKEEYENAVAIRKAMAERAAEEAEESDEDDDDD